MSQAGAVPYPGWVTATAKRSSTMANWSFVVMVLGVLTALSAVWAGGFVVDEVIPYALGVLLLGLGLAVVSRIQRAKVQQAAGLSPRDSVASVRLRGQLLIGPTPGPVLAVLLALAAFCLAVMSSFPSLLAARTLHATATATAQTVVTTQTGCGGRCSRTVVTFAANGRTVREQLAEAGQDEQAPLAVVYDATDPSRVMTAADYQRGRSTELLNRFFGGLLMGGAAFGACSMLIGRDQRRYGHARPGVPMSNLELRTPARGASTWRVTWADGKHVDYLDLPAQRPLLAQRIAADPAHFSPSAPVSAELRLALYA